MFAEAVTKLAETGASKARFLTENPLGFWISSMMAGVYVGFGILLIFSLGSVLDPSVRPLVMGGTFGLHVDPGRVRRLRPLYRSHDEYAACRSRAPIVLGRARGRMGNKLVRQSRGRFDPVSAVRMGRGRT